jgi:hypothetical protein
MARPAGSVHYQTEEDNERDEDRQFSANDFFQNFVTKHFPVKHTTDISGLQDLMIDDFDCGGKSMWEATDREGRTPMDYAVKYGLFHVVNYLEDRGEYVPSKPEVMNMFGSHYSRVENRITDAIMNDLLSG